jgi:FMN phosphatase YigB (HAD superfamily)
MVVTVETVNAVVVFDADNTLWDTAGIFRFARRELLKALGRSGLPCDSEADEIALRRLDFKLAEATGTFEYDFRRLAKSAACLFSRRSTLGEASAVAWETSADVSLPQSEAIEQAYAAFQAALEIPAPLYKDAEYVLPLLRDSGNLVTVLFSEGNPARVGRTLEAHRIELLHFFDEIVIRPKTREAWEYVKQTGRNRLDPAACGQPTVFILVGDSIERDIKLGNQAGFVTVFRPQDFLGQERSCEPYGQPHYTISTLRELPEILRRIRVPYSNAPGVRT